MTSKFELQIKASTRDIQRALRYLVGWPLFWLVLFVLVQSVEWQNVYVSIHLNVAQILFLSHYCILMQQRNMKHKQEKDIARRVKIVIGQLNGIGRMLEQQREFTDIYMQLSAVKASIEAIEVMLIVQEIGLDKRSVALAKMMNRKMGVLIELIKP